MKRHRKELGVCLETQSEWTAPCRTSKCDAALRRSPQAGQREWVFKQALTFGLLSCAFLWGSALYAQDSDEMSEEERTLRGIRERSEGIKPEGSKEEEETATPGGRDWDGMSDEELKAELQRSIEAVSKQMAELESELSKASLPPLKIDEMNAELRAAIEKLRNGDDTAIPSGLLDYLKAHPDTLAELLDMSQPEAEALLKKYQDGSDKTLETKLGEAAERLSALLEDTKILQDVLRRQSEVERDMSDALKSQEMLGRSTQDEIESALEAAYRLRRT